MEIVQTNSNAMKIVNCNDEAALYIDRKPTNNTIAYYKLEADTKDYSWNNRDLTASNITFENIWNISVAKFNYNSSTAYLDWTFISSITWNTPYTFWFWFKANSLSWLPFVGRSGKNKYGEHDKEVTILSTGALHVYNYSSAEHWFTTNAWLVSTWQRYCYVQTYDWTTLKAYLNNSLIGSVSPAPSYPYSSSWGWRFLLWKIYSNTNYWFNWYTSKLFIENVGWSISDVDDYYNKTKRKFWLA